MVQRKVTNKADIQADHVKTERMVLNFKPSSQDAKNRGADLKKIKMKKSGSIKRSEFESLWSPNLRIHVSQPGQPPPAVDRPTDVKTPPQKRLSVGGTITTPNYMKSTSSSDARKEKASQVSAKSPQTSPGCLSLRRKSSNSSNISSISGEKATKTLARTSSLKMMRTPSFKPVRNQAKKCSPVALCEDIDIQRATCSSTLKESKFPAYLTLSPGGTELEGTSAMKVCPYTYCSLNGHRHASLPPLKHFLSARRRVLKTQRSIKLGCLSPRRARPVGEGLNFDGTLSNPQDLAISPPTQEEQSDFFIEIYSQDKEDTADRMSLVEGGAEEHGKQLVETLSDGTVCDEIDTNQSLDHDGGLSPIDTAPTAQFHEDNQDVGAAEEISPPSMAQAETENGFQSEAQVEITPSAPFYELDSEASDMDWETGNYPALYLDDDHEYASKNEKEPVPEGGKAESCTFEEEFVSKLDNEIKSFFNAFLADEISDESYDEESMSSDIWSGTNDCESISSDDYQDSLDNVKIQAPVIVPEEKPEADPEDINDLLFEVDQISETDAENADTFEVETSSDNLTDECLPNNDATELMGDQASELLKGPVEEMVTSDGKDMVSLQTSADEGHQLQTEKQLSDECDIDEEVCLEKECNQDANLETSTHVNLEKERHSKVAKSAAKQETEDNSLALTIGKRKKPIEDSDELGDFNPRAPNFLPVEPEPESEKVDLRHQELDDKKNADEWMLDYALRQAVTKLGAARKRKVALLVEAFEKVTPISKCENHNRHNSAFLKTSPIQACR